VVRWEQLDRLVPGVYLLSVLLDGVIELGPYGRNHNASIADHKHSRIDNRIDI